MIGGDLSQEKPVNQSHRPVSMQWSDPLANRNVWSSSGKFLMFLKQRKKICQSFRNREHTLFTKLNKDVICLK